jgi:hypothetical protein
MGRQVLSLGVRAGAAFAAGPAAVVLALCFGHDPRAARRELEHRLDGYSGAAGCGDCHPDQAASWRRTFHATMTQRAGPETVLGAFDGRRVEYAGEEGRVFERDGVFAMEVPGPAGRRGAEVALCVGSRRYQQYFERVPRADGTFAYLRLPLLWHVEEERWMHMNTVFLHPDDANWDAHRAVWNANCIFCHNTGPRPGFQSLPPGGGPEDASYASAAADLGIACEACHGPGEEHARRLRDPLARLNAETNDVVQPAKLGQREAIAVCGQCHGQRLPRDPALLPTWLTSGPSYRPGDALEEHVALLARDTPSPAPDAPTLIADRFWGDGTPRLSAYEAQGVLASPCMADARFTCGACHSMHLSPAGDPRGMLEPPMRTNAACGQCHAEIAADPGGHSGHRADGPGSACLDCHMPRIAYGVIELHRSHRIESPDPARDAEAGRPNACTLCHLDQSPLWAAEEMTRMFARSYRAPRSRPSGAPVELADGPAWILAGDALERAAAAAAMGRAGAAGALEPAERAFLVGLLGLTLGDGYPAVRRLAARALGELERGVPLGLAELLRKHDPMDLGAREALASAVIQRLAEHGNGLFRVPPGGLGLTADFRIDGAFAARLIELQSARVIAIGE